MNNTIFTFHYFSAYQGENMAHLTLVDGDQIPMNICIDNADTVQIQKDDLCSVDVYGVVHDIAVFATQEEYRAINSAFAPISLIPIGTVSINPDNQDFKQSPHILFTGTVIDVQHHANVPASQPNYLLTIQTLGMTLPVYTRYEAPIQIGSTVQGIACLFGVLQRHP